MDSPFCNKMKKTPLKAKQVSLKKTPLKSNSKGLKGGYQLKKTSGLKSNNVPLEKTELKKQNDKAKAKWEEVRNQVLERDNYKCVVCGKPATQVHHIHLRSKRKDLLYEINNLISLCSKCHFHKSTELYEEQTKVIARAKHMTVEELLRFAETKSEE